MEARTVVGREDEGPLCDHGSQLLLGVSGRKRKKRSEDNTVNGTDSKAKTKKVRILLCSFAMCTSVSLFETTELCNGVPSVEG